MVYIKKPETNSCFENKTPKLAYQILLLYLNLNVHREFLLTLCFFQIPLQKQMNRSGLFHT